MKRKKLSICLITSTIFTKDFPARPEIIEVFGELFSSFGHNIIWVSPAYNRKIEKIEYNNITIFLIPYNEHKNTIRNSISFINHNIKKRRKIKDIIQEYEIDLIYSRINIVNGLIGSNLSKKYKIPFTYHMLFPKPIVCMDKDKNSLKSKIKCIFARLIQTHILKSATLILPLNSFLKEYLHNKGYNKLKMYSFTVGINPLTFVPQPKNELLLNKLQIKSSFVFMYVGKMSEDRQLNSIIRAFAEVKERKNKIKLIMVGDGDNRSSLEALSKSLNLEEHIIFTGEVPYNDIPSYISIADIGLAPIPPIELFKMSSPLKSLEYMGMGIPLIGNKEIYTMNADISASNGGMLVNYSVESFAKAMINLMNDEQLMSEMGENGRDWVKKNRSYQNIAKALEEQFYKLIDSKN